MAGVQPQFADGLGGVGRGVAEQPQFAEPADLRSVVKPAGEWNRYRILAVGWAAAPSQRRHLAGAVRTVNVLMVPLALAAYSVTASVRGMAQPGDAPLWGVSVLAGGLVSGVAVAIVVLRNLA